MKRSTVAIILFAFVVLSSSLLHAKPFSDKVDDECLLTMELPDGYEGTVDQDRREYKSWIFFNKERNKVLLLSVIQTRGASLDIDIVKDLTLRSGNRLLMQAVEKSLTLIEIKKGNTVVGHYYTLTDKAPKAGEYLMLTSGEILINGMIVSFTFMYNDTKENVAPVIQAMRTVDLKIKETSKAALR